MSGPSALARADSRGASRRARRTVADRIGVLFAGALILLGVGLTIGGIYDWIHRELVRPQAQRTWMHAQTVLIRRLHQEEPLEFGAVWATHSGMICGMVNGRRSFGGLAGMTPFAVEGDRTVFALDQTALAFAPYWRRCMTDQWITVVEGSMQAGGCETRLGQVRCVTAGE